MKRIFALLLVVCFSFAVVGCGDAKEKAKEVGKEVKEGGTDAAKKAASGDTEGAKKAAVDTAKDVGDTVTGADKKEGEGSAKKEGEK